EGVQQVAVGTTQVKKNTHTLTHHCGTAKVKSPFINSVPLFINGLFTFAVPQWCVSVCVCVWLVASFGASAASFMEVVTFTVSVRAPRFPLLCVCVRVCVCVCVCV